MIYKRLKLIHSKYEQLLYLFLCIATVFIECKREYIVIYIIKNKLCTFEQLLMGVNAIARRLVC